MALVDAQVNRHMYAFDWFMLFCRYRGPAKSSSVWQNGESSDTRSIGRSGGLTGAYGNPSKRLHTTHFRNMRLTDCLAFKIQ